MKRKESMSSPDKNSEQRNKMSRTTGLYINNVSEKWTKKNDILLNQDQKYDRQLRLWGERGQDRLSNASVCLLNATATGAEILKCLILPGVGRFYIIGNSAVTSDDLSNNFFCNVESEGKPRAQVVCSFLQELNRDSRGSYLLQDPESLLENDPEFFKQFSVVVATCLSEHALVKFSHYLWQLKIPFVVCDNFGFFGYLRVMVKEHVVIESHPDNAVHDLRLDKPFKGLASYMNSICLREMDKVTHSHTPFLVILYKFLEEWQLLNDNKWPGTYKEKLEIKQLIRDGVFKNEHGDTELEENFDEALRHVNTAFSLTKIPSSIREIFSNEMCNHPHGENTKFWILVRALKEYANQNECLPLRGTLPDMFSDSKRYIELQRLYKQKANDDVQEVSNIVAQALIDMQLPPTFLSRDEIKLFCKNAHFLNVTTGRALHEEFKTKNVFSLGELQCDFAEIYVLFRTMYRIKNAVILPVKLDDFTRVAQDIALQQFGEICDTERVFEEVLRLNCSELHSVASAMGGMCAQEIVKLITQQFITMDNTYIYNGIMQETTTLKI